VHFAIHSVCVGGYAVLPRLEETKEIIESTGGKHATARVAITPINYDLKSDVIIEAYPIKN
jgi:hypothetical protein